MAITLALGSIPAAVKAVLNPEDKIQYLDFNSDKVNEVLENIRSNFGPVMFENYRAMMRDGTVATSMLNHVMGVLMFAVEIKISDISTIFINWDDPEAAHNHYTRLVELWAGRHCEIICANDVCHINAHDVPEVA